MEEQDARKAPIAADEALQLAATMTEIYAARGKKVTHIRVKKDKPDEATLTKQIVGPSGNLRAPALRIGKKLLVGFHEETYQQLLE